MNIGDTVFAFVFITQSNDRIDTILCRLKINHGYPNIQDGFCRHTWEGGTPDMLYIHDLISHRVVEVPLLASEGLTPFRIERKKLDDPIR